MMSRITLNLRKAANQSHTQTFNSTITQEPKRTPWLLGLFPGARRAMGSLWESSFAQLSFFEASTSARPDPADIQLEDVHQRQELSGYRRQGLGIQFATPDPDDFTPQTTKVGNTASDLA